MNENFSRAESRRFLPESLQNFLDSAAETEFVQKFCQFSWKKDGFNFQNQLELQLVAGILIFAQIYLSILCTVRGLTAPVFSGFVALYALASLYAYFSHIGEVSAINAAQSYCASVILALFSVVFLIQGNFSLSFFVMTVLLCADAYKGVTQYVNRDNLEEGFQLEGSYNSILMKSALKPTHVKNFVFKQTQIDTI